MVYGRRGFLPGAPTKPLTRGGTPIKKIPGRKIPAGSRPVPGKAPVGKLPPRQVGTQYRPSGPNMARGKKLGLKKNAIKRAAMLKMSGKRPFKGQGMR